MSVRTDSLCVNTDVGSICVRVGLQETAVVSPAATDKQHNKFLQTHISESAISFLC